MAPDNHFSERPPRIQPQLPVGDIEIPPPPDKNRTRQQSLLEMLLPLVTILGYVLISITGRGRSLMLIIPMGLAMFGSIALSYMRSREADKDLQRKTEAYEKRLAELRQQMRNDHQIQRDFYYYNYPDPGTLIELARKQATSRAGSRIWERRVTDADFGVIRIGIGVRQSTRVFSLSQQGNDEDPQMDKARRLAQDSQYVTDVPITLKLYQSQSAQNKIIEHDTQHTLGIYAVFPHEIQKLYDYIRAILVHFTAFHTPIDSHLYVIGSENSKEQWAWAQLLPHSSAGSDETRLCFEGEQTEVRTGVFESRLPLFLKDLRDTLQERQQRLSENEAVGVTLPFVLVIVDLCNIDDDSVLNDIEMDQAISLISQHGHELGAAVIFITPDSAQIPSSVQAVIEVETVESGRTAFRYAEVGINSARYVGIADLLETQLQANSLVRELSQYQIRTTASASLPITIDLLQMNRVSDINDLDIQTNWYNSIKPQNSEWPRVKLGAYSAQDMRELEFEANVDGVHGMIAGTTGSGKSELLQTMIAGLAINYAPSIVNFVLVDFKGGAAFEEFKSLPHCVDIITNLEGNAVDRMFAAIYSELDRRGEMVAKYNVKHCVDYREKGYHLQLPPELSERGLKPQPFPHLFIIIDEFAEMVAKNPEYKAQLESVTRLGRAIGVHLILATQRPEGMVTDQMRANMKMKICLRVETPNDSREILRRSDAAYLPTTVPGRGFLQIGNEVPE